MCDYIVYFSLVRFNITFVYSIIIINIKPNRKKLFKKKIMFSLVYCAPRRLIFNINNKNNTKKKFC